MSHVLQNLIGHLLTTFIPWVLRSSHLKVMLPKVMSPETRVIYHLKFLVMLPTIFITCKNIKMIHFQKALKVPIDQTIPLVYLLTLVNLQ